MNVAIVLAGGIGRRMGVKTPKQFISVLGKPVIVHTLEVLEKNQNIDAIEVVTVGNFIDEVAKYRDIYKISKLRWITSGGETCQDSIRNGVLNLEDKISPDDIVSLIMSVTPLISDDVIDDSIRVCKKYGNAIAGSYPIYNLSTIKYGSKDADNEVFEEPQVGSITDINPTEGFPCIWADDIIRKEEHIDLNMPWTFPMNKLTWAYHKAYDEGLEIMPSSYTTNLMIALGEKLYFSKDTQRNKLKLTTFDDVDMLEGYLLIQEIRKGNVEAIKKLRINKGDI
jgi:2-C-methyl-D-erythritol 4-phosphate cytidylyltransferase